IHDNSLRADHGCPVFCFDTADGFFYGFPATDSDGLKVGEHSGGEEIADPDRLDRSLHPHDTDRVCGFVQRHLSGVDLTPHSHSVCMYTMTPDEHFVVDRHPRFANVFLAAGFSGHGFKFAPVIGSVMADLVTAGRTDTPIGFLSALRSDLCL
ncbi:MAG: FAD-dependent oxidoreductase, partial [Phycisphaerae bacterium]